MKLLKKLIFGLIISLPLASMFLVSPSNLLGNKAYAATPIAGKNGNDGKDNGNNNGNNPSDGYKNFQDFADMIIKVFSWFWVVPAILAGKLMSNDFAYGKVFGLDIYLWKMWVIMKTFANYGLGFALIFAVVKTLFQKEPLSTIKQVFPKVFIAGVLIQASWFLLGALIDISTIMTAAVASVPIQMIKEGEDYQAIMNRLLQNVPKECTFYNNMSKDIRTFADCNGKIEMNDEVKDYLTPSYKNLDGPLVFLGYAILRFQDMTFLSSDQTTSKSIGLGMMIKAMIILMFFVPMVVLMFANLIRIFYIWLWAVFSPFIVLFTVFGGKTAEAAKQTKQGSRIFNIGELFGLVFQPVAVVGAMSVAFMLVLGLAQVFYGMNESSGGEGGTDKNVFAVKNCDDGDSAICGTLGNAGAQVKFKGSILKDLKDVVGGSLGYLILTFFTIYLVWGVVRIGFHTSKITSGMADSSFKFVGGMIKAAHILPGGASLGAVQKLGRNIAPNTYGKRESKQATAIQEKIEQGFGLNSGINSNDMNEIDRKTAGVSNDYEYTDKYFDALRDVLSTKKTSFMTDPNLGTTVMRWANGRGKQYLSQLGVKLPDNATLEDLLNDERGRKFVDKALKGEIKDFKPEETNKSLEGAAPDKQKVRDTMYGK